MNPEYSLYSLLPRRVKAAEAFAGFNIDTLPEWQLSERKQHLESDFDTIFEALQADQDIVEESLTEVLKGIKEAHQQTLLYPIPAPLLAAYFIKTSSIGLFINRLQEIDEFEDPMPMGYPVAEMLFAQYFDIHSGAMIATNRFIIVEEELHGKTAERIEKIDQGWQQETGVSTTPVEFAQSYGEKIMEAKRLADLYRTSLNNNDPLIIPGIVLFNDLMDSIKRGESVPGVLPISFRELILLGIADTKRMYKLIYPFADLAVS